MISSHEKILEILLLWGFVTPLTGLLPSFYGLRNRNASVSSWDIPILGSAIFYNSSVVPGGTLLASATALHAC